MSDDEEAGPVVELGPGADEPVEGAPIARVASRLQWPIERSRIEQLEGGTTIRTPDGPRELSSVLDDLDVTYFDERRTFVDAVRDAVGRGPIPTARFDGQDDPDGDTNASGPESDGADDDDPGTGHGGADETGSDGDERLEDPELFDDAGDDENNGVDEDGDRTANADG